MLTNKGRAERGAIGACATARRGRASLLDLHYAAARRVRAVEIPDSRAESCRVLVSGPTLDSSPSPPRPIVSCIP